MEDKNIPTQIIKIPVQSNIDPAQLLDIILEFIPQLQDEIESNGEETTIDEDEVTVSDGGE